MKTNQLTNEENNTEKMLSLSNFTVELDAKRVSLVSMVLENIKFSKLFED